MGMGTHRQQLKTESVSLTEATHLQVKDEDATDSADIITQAYVEKYSVTITPTAWMKAYGKRATLIVEYIIKTDPGAGTVSVCTKVDGNDTTEETGLTISSGKQTHIHSDIIDFTSDLVVSLEAKNTDAGQTSVLDYCNIYLQIGTKDTSGLEIFKITDVQSLDFVIEALDFKVWTGAAQSAILTLGKDVTGLSTVSEAGSDVSKLKFDLPAEFNVGPINEYFYGRIATDNAINPAVFERIRYQRVWLE